MARRWWTRGCASASVSWSKANTGWSRGVASSRRSRSGHPPISRADPTPDPTSREYLRPFHQSAGRHLAFGGGGVTSRPLGGSYIADCIAPDGRLSHHPSDHITAGRQPGDHDVFGDGSSPARVAIRPTPVVYVVHQFGR